MNRACVVCNGELSDGERTQALCRAADLLIAADGGVRHLTAMGLRPRIVIGDKDSAPAGVWGADPAIEWIALDPEKDRTDTEAAVDLALSRGCGQVLLLAALGGRTDHLLANAALVGRHPGQVAIWHDGGTLVALAPGHKARLDGAIGSTVSLLQWGDEAPCIYTRGLKYFLHGTPLRNATHGMSNEMVERPAYVRVKAGVLLLWVSSGGVDTGENASNGRGL